MSEVIGYHVRGRTVHAHAACVQVHCRPLPLTAGTELDGAPWRPCLSCGPQLIADVLADGDDVAATVLALRDLTAEARDWQTALRERLADFLIELAAAAGLTVVGDADGDVPLACYGPLPRAAVTLLAPLFAVHRLPTDGPRPCPAEVAMFARLLRDDPLLEGATGSREAWTAGRWAVAAGITTDIAA